MSRQNTSVAKVELMECAVKLFQEYGYNKVSIRQICNTCGISKTTFYFHYKSKEELVLDFFNRVDIGIEKNIAVVFEGETSVKQLWNLTTLYLQHHVYVGVNVSREVYVTYLYNNLSPVMPQNVHIREALLNLLNLAKKKKEIANQSDVPDLYDTLNYTMTGVIYNWHMADGNFDLLEVSKKAFDSLLMPLE